MQVLVSGGSGLLGSHLIPALQHEGCVVAKIVRHHVSGRSRNVAWSPQSGTIDMQGLEGFHAVVHLAGEAIDQGRWTAAKKERIRTSRVEGTRQLCEALAQVPRKPKVLICASAVGYYGDRGAEELNEDSQPGEGFLAEVCQEWEAACEPARAAGIRVVNLRLGVILTTQGGALAKMLPIFRAGLGGPLGLGSQYMSWVGLQDVIGAIKFCIGNPAMEGPVNVVSPTPVNSREFAKALGKKLRRPSFVPVPGFGVRLLFGEMGDALLLSGAKVFPEQLLAHGFTFRFQDLEHALEILIPHNL